MTSLLNRLLPESRPLWIEYDKYAGRLLNGGIAPWLDIGQLISWQRKAATLLPSDVISLRVSAVISQWQSENLKLVQAMAEKRRVGSSLRTLLAELTFRKHLVDLASGLRTSFRDHVLALVIPSPTTWIVQAHEQAFRGETIQVDLDAIDSASVYVADFLRALSDVGFDVLLIEENVETDLNYDEVIDAYKPIVNLADHYQWELGIKITKGNPVAATSGPDFWISPQLDQRAVVGLAIGNDFWTCTTSPQRPENGFFFMEIPTDENPERVLERLAVLR